MLCSVCRVQVWTAEPIPCTRMEHVSLLQSHFSCLSHDHTQCSCIGGPVRLVQSHFTCHSHDRSSCFFFVLVYSRYTCVKLLHDTPVYSHERFLLHALFHASRSSVSVVLRFLFQHPLSALTSLPKVAVAFLYETSHNKLSELSNTRP